MVVWISGITASGKTTLGIALKKGLNDAGFHQVVHLDGDELRKRPGWIQGHSLEDRFAILLKLIKLILEEEVAGNVVIVSTVSHKQKMRDFAREKIADFHEVCLNCAPKICVARDYKGFYKRAKDSLKTGDGCYPGVSQEYEINNNSELILNTGDERLNESSSMLIDYVLCELKKNGAATKVIASL